MEKPWYKLWPAIYPKSLRYYEGSIVDFMEASARKFPDRKALIFMEKPMTYGELLDQTLRLAAALAHLGVKKGDRVALFMPNCPQFVVSYYAVLKIGAILTMCSPLNSEEELKFQLNDSGSETIITLKLKLLMDKLIKVKEQTGLKRIIVSGLDEALPLVKKQAFLLFKKKNIAPVLKNPEAGIYFFKDLIDEYPPSPPRVTIDAKEDVAVLAYTGGTTGLPKGAMITHYNTIVNASQVMNWMAPALGYKIVENPNPENFNTSGAHNMIVNVVPWFHAMGTIAYLNNPIFSAMTIYVLPRFDPGEYLKIVKKYPIDGMGGAPPIYTALLNHPDFPKYAPYFKKVKFAGSGAGPLPVAYLNQMKEVVGGVFIEAYGMTECTMAICFNPAAKEALRKPGSVGLPLFDSEIRIVDLVDDTKEVPIGQEGEILQRGPQVMKGYWNKPEETAKTLKDGWLHSGDIGRIDEDGYLYIVDRIKDMIKYKGYNVFARNLEEILYRHPKIKEAAVIGIPDPAVTEYPRAYVVLNQGETATAEEIMEFINSQVAGYEKVREVVFRTDLPVSLAGKVLKKELKKEALAERQEPPGGKQAVNTITHDIKVMTSGAFTSAHLALIPLLELLTKKKIVTAATSIGTGENSIPNRLKRGEVVDVVIVADALLRAFIQDGLVLSETYTPLARSVIGMAVRAGAPIPDISTAEALKRTLLHAKSIGYSASVSGRYLTTELYQRLGIADQVIGKSRLIGGGERVGAVIARGEVEIGFQQISELLPVPGIAHITPLPPEVQKVSSFSAGVAATTTDSDLAYSVIKFFASPEAVPAIIKSGLEPIGNR